jgi:hypothetical protein
MFLDTTGGHLDTAMLGDSAAAEVLRILELPPNGQLWSDLLRKPSQGIH